MNKKPSDRIKEIAEGIKTKDPDNLPANIFVMATMDYLDEIYQEEKTATENNCDHDLLGTMPGDVYCTNCGLNVGLKEEGE